MGYLGVKSSNQGEGETVVVHTVLTVFIYSIWNHLNKCFDTTVHGIFPALL